jgi:hypothetical protein
VAYFFLNQKKIKMKKVNLFLITITSIALMYACNQRPSNNPDVNADHYVYPQSKDSSAKEDSIPNGSKSAPEEVGMTNDSAAKKLNH